MIPSPLNAVRPATMEEALAALGETDARALAGGQSLIPLLKLRFARPTLLVDLAEVAELHTSEDAVLGALKTWRQLTAMPRRGALASVADAAACVGDLQVRNRGTIGGGLAHADPACDVAAAVLATEAILVLRSSDGERRVASEDFFVGPFMSALEPGELLTRVEFTDLAAPSAYSAFADPASGYPLAGAAISLKADGARIGITGVAARPFRAHAAESALTSGSDLGQGLLTDLANVELLDDGRVPLAYREQLACVVVNRALEHAQARKEAT